MYLHATIFGLITAIFLQGAAARSYRYLTSSAKTTLATFNTGLVPYLPTATDPEIELRTLMLIEQLLDSDVDIFCLQELYFADLQRQIYRALRNKYPYMLSAVDLTINDDPTLGPRACLADDLLQLQQCTVQECSDAQALGLFPFLDCIANRCSNNDTSLACVICIQSYLPVLNADICLTLPASRFDQTFGLMLLSRKALTNTRVTGYNNQSQITGYMEASVDGVGDLVCTHVSASLSDEFYFGPPSLSTLLYSNYDEQQYDEISTLLEVIASKDTPILMGDLNSGPAPPGITWILPFHYGLINARGLVSPYVLEDGRCTFCKDNPSVAVFGITTDTIIDHIYILTNTYKSRVLSSERILDNIMTENGNPLSDHYGVKVTLRDIRSNCRWWERRRFYCPATPSAQLLPLPPPDEELSRLCVAI